MPILRTILTSLITASATLLGQASAEPLTTSEAMAAPHAPVITVRDTVSSLGPLAASDPQQVTLADLVRYHGHPCDGLIAAAAGVAYGLQQLFPEGVVDRTDLAAAVNGSACYGDVVAYLTGTRHRYGSMSVDPKLGDTWILHRRSTGDTVRVELRPGMKPAELPGLETRLRAAECPTDLITRVQEIQRGYALDILNRPPAEVFVIARLQAFPYATGKPRPDAAKATCPQSTNVEAANAH